MGKISSLKGYVIRDSRGNATVEVEVTTEDGARGVASVPSGISTGGGEAVAIDAETAALNIQREIAPRLSGFDVIEQQNIDYSMINLDGTPEKKRLGANAILGVSLAVARAAAATKKIPLYRYIAELVSNENLSIPVPMFNLINGGKHAHNNIDFQEFMVVPTGLNSYSERLEAGKKIFTTLSQVLIDRKLKTNIGDEGGYAPDLDTNEMAFGLLVDAIKQAGLEPGKNVFLALDVAASYLSPTFQLNTQRYLDMFNTFPIISLEDPLPEDDWHWWSQLKMDIERNNKTGRPFYLVGDDLFVTHIERLKKGINSYVANAILVKINQVGTLTETLEVIKLAKDSNYTHIISHRSGETEDDFIADLAVGTGAQFIKAGAPNESHRERMVKYERLLAIEKELQ